MEGGRVASGGGWCVGGRGRGGAETLVDFEFECAMGLERRISDLWGCSLFQRFPLLCMLVPTYNGAWRHDLDHPCR